MTETRRVVGQLRLRAHGEAAVRATLPRLEDAFRTATLPDAGAPLVLVRRLHLGRLPARASPQALALAIEARFAAAHATPVHAADARAGTAQAIWFHDALEAHRLAALRAAAGEPLSAWFWPLAVPALRVARTSSERLRAIACSVAALQEAPAALPAWVGSLVRAGYCGQLVAALEHGDGATLLRAAGEDPAAALSSERAGVATPRLRGGESSDAANARFPIGGGARGQTVIAAPDDRHAVVALLCARAGVSYAAVDAELPHEKPATRRTAGHPTSGSADLRAAIPVRWRDAAGGDPSPAGGRPARPAPPPSVPNASAAPSAERLGGSTAADSAFAAAGDDRPRDSAKRRGVSEPESRGREAPCPGHFPGHAPMTSAGGLLFLVPVLGRLGFGDARCRTGASAGASPRAVAASVFGLLLARLRVDPEDPVWSLASPSPGAGPPGGAASPSPPIGDPARVWLSACRRLLRRRAGIGPASLVRRPARLALTETHADVFFAPAAADLRVRRAGLDVDPGWVPWLGRIVAFHYRELPWT